MKSAVNYTTKKVPMERLRAFTLFQKDGMSAVEQTYPEHVQFVREHQAKTYREVKRQLLGVYQEV